MKTVRAAFFVWAAICFLFFVWLELANLDVTPMRMLATYWPEYTFGVGVLIVLYWVGYGNRE